MAFSSAMWTGSVERSGAYVSACINIVDKNQLKIYIIVC